MRVPVVAGIIRDERRRVLVARHEKRDRYHGQWEFPGGKVEGDECPEAALARELAEELGIVVRDSEPLIEVYHDYPDIRVRLCVREVTRYAGVPVSREGQVLRWAAERELPRIDLLAANRPIVTAARLPDRYVITDAGRYGADATLARLESLLADGLRLVQVREKHLARTGFATFFAAVAKRTRRYGAVVLVNGEPETALALGADGVHLESRRLRDLASRPLDPGLWVAASCHDREEIEHAGRIGVDFAVLGPVRSTASHPQAPVLGWTQFSALCRGANFPVYALGGLAPGDRDRARAAGAQGVAMISAAWNSKAPA